MPEGLRQDVFLPFFTTKAKGTGVGLSLARQVVLAHRGSISVGDRESGGALFRILIWKACPGSGPGRKRIFARRSGLVLERSDPARIGEAEAVEDPRRLVADQQHHPVEAASLLADAMSQVSWRSGWRRGEGRASLGSAGRSSRS